MTPEALRKLIANGETLDVECKGKEACRVRLQALASTTALVLMLPEGKATLELVRVVGEVA